VIGVYNLVQNLAVPIWAYVPANLAVSAGLVALARRGGATADDLGLKAKRLGHGVRLGLIAAAGLSAVIALAAMVPATRPFFADARVIGHRGWQVVYRALVRFPLGTALFEEVAFRGVLFGLFRRRLGVAGAAHVTAAAFGAWHLIPTYQALQGNPAADLLALGPGVATGALITVLSSYGLVWLRLRADSLAAPWVAHAAGNSLGYLAGVAVGG
jgi:membrane protease YdiL (CAAX protease family)